MKHRFIGIALFLLVLLASCGVTYGPATGTTSTVVAPPKTSTTPGALPPSGAASIQVAQNATLGQILADQKGMTLYLITTDTATKISCTGDCATTWPPLTTTSGKPTTGTGVDSSKLGTITRPEGTTQITYNGHPLYYFSGDKKAGDTNGQGIGGVWYVVSTAGDAVKK